MKKLLAAVLVLSLVGSVGATSLDEDVIQQALENTTAEQLQQLKQEVNANSENVPDFVKSIAGDQRINLYINASQEESFRLETTGSSILVLEEGSWDSPTLEIWTDSGTLTEFVNSDEPGKLVREKLDDGGVNYEAHGFWNTLKFSLIDIFL